MFIRWKRRKLKKRAGYSPGAPWDPNHQGYALSAVLVQSERVDGKVRQRFVKHLGSIKDWGLTTQGHRLGFWQTAEKALDSLDLDPATRQRIEAKLAETVEPFTPEDLARIKKEAEAWYQRMHSLLAGSRRRRVVPTEV